MPQNSWLQGENSFLQGIDAGNRLFESIADVQSKQFALESARTELPLRLMDLQLQNQQRMQSLKIQQEEAPLKLENLRLQHTSELASIESQQQGILLKAREIDDQAKTANFMMRWNAGEDVEEPVLTTMAGRTLFQTQKAATERGHKEAIVKAEWDSNLSKLKPDQFNEIMNMPLGEGGRPTPIAYSRMADYLKMNQEEAQKTELKAYTDKQDAMGERQKALIEAKNEGRLAEITAKNKSDFETHSDPFIKRQYLAGVASINADPSIVGAEAKIAAHENLRKKLTNPGAVGNQISAWDQKQVSVIDDKLGKLADQRVALIVEDPTGKRSSTRKKIEDIDAQRRSLEEYKQSLTGSTKPAASGSDDGVVDYDPKSRSIKGGASKSSEAIPPDQGPEYDRALDGHKGSDMVGSIRPKKASTPVKMVFETMRDGESFLDYMNRIEKEAAAQKNPKAYKDIIMDGVRQIMDERFK